MNQPKIMKRVYYKISIKTSSPLNVAGGSNILTDSDVLRNGDGECFVPGTALAGAFRNALHLERNKDGFMGFSDGEDGKMSRVYISDLYFGEVINTVRDGVKLEADKTVENKFDMEIIETGASGDIFVNYIVREADDEKKFENAMCEIIHKMQNGTIRFGGNKNRGFGRVSVQRVSRSSFDACRREEYLQFKKNFKTASYQTEQSFEEWMKTAETEMTEDYIRISVPLKQCGGISIRKYSAQPNKADYSHITCAGKPVIPGSSWNGAIRSACAKLLTSLGCDKKAATNIIESWFGCIKGDNQSEKSISRQSRIVVGESVIENAVAVPMTRTSVNRFDASTKKGALYSEIAYFGGNTCLELMVEKDSDGIWLEIIGMLKLVIEDICEGYTAVGGQTAVGRGIFEKNGEVTYSEQVQEDCMAALYSRIGGLR